MRVGESARAYVARYGDGGARYQKPESGVARHETARRLLLPAVAATGCLGSAIIAARPSIAFQNAAAIQRCT